MGIIIGKRLNVMLYDTIVGKDGHGAIVTLTERSTNMLFMRKLNKGKNVNGLIRQYILKNTCFSNISQQQITKIMQIINTRPREKLNFSTPNECFYKKML